MVVLVPSPATAQGAFSDDDGNVHEAALDSLAARGVLAGTECGQGRICPEDPISRATIAVWLTRVLDNAEPPRVASSRFADVDAGLWWAAHVERFATLGVTRGCATGPLRYCPDDTVTRGQMAAFLNRAFALSAAGSAGFGDTSGHTFEDEIDALAAARITTGCSPNPPLYCPDNAVTRGQMATFITRALNLVPSSSDRDALVALYNATNGPHWTHNTNWLSDRPIGDWHGVITDAGGRVTSLSLDGNQLSGQIPTRLGNLHNLQTLSLASNQLSGQVPAELGALTQLTRLHLGDNQLTGELPLRLTGLTALQDFFFHNNSGLCAPLDNVFQTWVLGIRATNGSQCPAAVPGAPTGLGATVGDGQVTLSWSAPSSDGGSPITGYQYSQDSGSWTPIPGSRPGQANAVGYTLTGLTNDRTYNFQIRAVNAQGVGQPSNSVSARPELRTGVPGAPIGLWAEASVGVILRWFAPASDGGSPITGYEYSQDGGPWISFQAVVDVWSSYTVTGLTAERKYDFQIRAVNAQGAGPPSDRISVRALGPPGAPSGLSAVARDGLVVLSWNAPSSDGGSAITGYEYSQNSGSWTPIPSSRPGFANAVGYTVTGLTNGSTYNFQIRAVNAQGGGQPSNSVSARPVRATVPGAPTGLRASGSSQVVFL